MDKSGEAAFGHGMPVPPTEIRVPSKAESRSRY